MRRRDTIRTGLVAGASLFLPRAATGQTRAEGRLPDTPVSTETVQPGESMRLIPADAWVVHRLGCYTTGNEVADALREMRDKPRYQFRVDGDPVDSPNRFWGDIYRREDQRLGLSWRYALPPQPKGSHRFEVEVKFPSPIRYTDDRGREQVWKGSEAFDCVYRVQDFGDEEPAVGHGSCFQGFGGSTDE